MNKLSPYLPSEGDVNFGDATGGHGRCGVESTELLNKRFRKGRVGFEVIELIGVLQKSDDALEIMKACCVRDSIHLVSFGRDRSLRD